MEQDTIDQIVALNKEEKDLLRRAQECDAELAEMSKSQGRPEMRAALIRHRDSLHHQRFGVKNKLKTLLQQKKEADRNAALGSMAGVSPTAQLRDATRRVGALEWLFATLAARVDDDGGWDDFDWRIPVRKAMRQLQGVIPFDNQNSTN